MSAVTTGTSYYLYAGIQDGDLAWVTPVGVAVKAPWPLTEGVELLLAYRPDLLKGAVSGTITGVGLDPARDPEAYGTALIVKVSTGETVGFQLITPVGAVPVPFSRPVRPRRRSTRTPTTSPVARSGTGRTLWTTDAGVPVITKDNAQIERDPHGHRGPGGDPDAHGRTRRLLPARPSTRSPPTTAAEPSRSC